MPTRRNNDEADERFYKLTALVGWFLLAVIAGVIGQSVFGWLVPKNGTGGGSVPANIEQRLSDLETSDKKQDVSIGHLRFDLNSHLRFHGVSVGSDGRPVGSAK